MSEETSAPRNGLERHLQTLIGTIGLGLMTWIFVQMNTAQIDITRMTEQILNIRELVQDMKRDSYSAKQAGADLALRDSRILRLEARIETLERASYRRPEKAIPNE